VFKSHVRAAVQKGVSPEVYSLIRRDAVLEATDSRDYIYSLLDISADADNVALLPDYSQSMETVLHNYSKFLLPRENGIDILYDVGFPRGFPNLPSWVPDYTTPRNQTSLGRLLNTEDW
jgi:hypothetical protein